MQTPILGTLTEYGDQQTWQGELTLECFEEPVTVFVMLFEESSNPSLTLLQSDFLQKLQGDCENFQGTWLASILTELQADPTIWGMWEKGDEIYEIVTSIEDTNALKNMLNQPQLFLLPNKDGQVSYGFGFAKTEWDDEHGYGVCFVGDKCVQSGPLEAAVDEVFQSLES